MGNKFEIIVGNKELYRTLRHDSHVPDSQFLILCVKQVIEALVLIELTEGYQQYFNCNKNTAIFLLQTEVYLMVHMPHNHVSVHLLI